MNDFFTQTLGAGIELLPDRIRSAFFGKICPIFKLPYLTSEETDTYNEQFSHVKWCLEYLSKRNYTPISLEQYLKERESPDSNFNKKVVFTFDDGFQQQHTITRELLETYEIPVTFFLITDFVDGRIWPWDDQIRYVIYHSRLDNFDLKMPDASVMHLSNIQSNPHSQLTKLRDQLKLINQSGLYSWLETLYESAELPSLSSPPDNYQPITWQQAQQLINDGHAIAAHSKTHRILSKLSPEESEAEINGSYNRIAETLTRCSPAFAYPTGREEDYEKKDIEILMSSKMKYALTTASEYALPSSDPFQIPRFSLPETRFHFVQYISYFEALKSRIRNIFR